MNETIVSNVDTNKLQDIFNQTDINMQYFEGVVADLSASCTQHLDEIMKDIYNNGLTDASTPIVILEEKLVELNNILYFMGDKLDNLSVKAELAKKAAKEIYNNSYLSHQVKDVVDKKNKTTVAELTAIAEKDSIYEATVEDMYSHAESRIKFKIDAGYQMVKAISKIITRRMNEISYDAFSRGNPAATSPQGKQLLVERYENDNREEVINGD